MKIFKIDSYQSRYRIKNNEPVLVICDLELDCGWQFIFLNGEIFDPAKTTDFYFKVPRVFIMYPYLFANNFNYDEIYIQTGGAIGITHYHRGQGAHKP